jgi:hypothetical protein
MRELFPKQKSKFVDAVVGADRSVFGEPTASPSSGSNATDTLSGAGGVGSDETDLDHEEDVNILGRIERELRRLESEELSSLSTSTAAPPIDDQGK